MVEDITIAKSWLLFDIFPPESSLVIKNLYVKKLISQMKKQQKIDFGAGWQDR